MRVSHPNARRGVLLLIILALLAMFAIVAVAFVVLTGHAMRSSRAAGRQGRQVDPPQQVLHRIAMRVFTGSNNPVSAIGPHGLLEDIYGSGWVGGALGVVSTAVCGGQLIEVTIPGANPERRIGCVLTMLNGPAAGKSTHIVGVNPVSGNPLIRAFEGGVVPIDQNQCMLNGAAYSGTGFGWDATDGNVTATNAQSWEIALLPGASENWNPAGGANEDYDAVDYNNLMLAAQFDTGSGTLTIPSLHRPALVNYWATRSSSDWDTTPELFRQVILRPLPADHPNFTGSNPSFHPVNGPWDVDNDGDGVPDGIWVDPGLPVRSTADGRHYKVLVSVLCLDMDGRLNINAHGMWAQTESAYYDPADTASETPVAGAKFAGGATTASLPRGQGYGPAEINLRPLFADPDNPGSYFYDSYRALLAGRYQESGATSGPGATGTDDPLSQNISLDHQSSHWGFWTAPATYVPSAYGSPCGAHGISAVGLDVAGRPLYLSMDYPNRFTTLNTNSRIDDPYEINLIRNGTHGLTTAAPIDNPFGVSELERLLRPFDSDAGRLPQRLFSLTGGDISSGTASVLHQRRHDFTTESWNVPCPAPRVTDLLIAKGVNKSVWAELLPPELLAGLKMDINRPLGNALDDDTDGIVDEPGEASDAEPLTLYDRPGNTWAGTLSYLPAGAGDSLAARQLYARHLYVLLMLLTDTDFPAPGWDIGTWTPLTTDQRVAQWAPFLAQWAVNVVDFRDRDSIMTPFEYDIAPFDGWGVDGDPTTDDGEPIPHVVWGCERPELLITETLAFHDRRTEDTATDPSGKTTTDAETPDTDFDQVFKPQGLLFIELFNPWTALEPQTGELYTACDGGVDLTRTAGGSPVWRLIIVDDSDADDDPDDPVVADRPDIERAIYFVDPTVVTLPAGGSVKFGPDTTYAAQIAPVLPGRYAVIGPGTPGGTGTSSTYIGFRVGENQGDGSTRRIDLTPSTDPATQQVQVFSAPATAPADDLADLSIQPAAAVVINAVVDAANTPLPAGPRLSISEPDGGYPTVDSQGGAYVAATGYPTPYDAPLDTGTEIKISGRTDPNNFFKVVHLQRLANPLAAYNAVTNPYRTIDSMSIDLTSFNGITNAADPEDSGSEENLLTRERGESNDSAGTNNIWSHEPYDNPPNSNTNILPVAAASHYFNNALHHSLGYLNDSFQPLGSVANYVGAPQTPFPWLTWNNRPFVSQLELLLAPAARCSKLLTEYELAPGTPLPYTDPSHPFPHLLNFFQSAATSASGGSPQFHRLLEYVHVPSRFVGVDIQADPTACATGSHPFHPPFNRIPTCREPGRINLNTIFSSDVLSGLMNNYPGMSDAAFWSKFVFSRRGYGDASGGIVTPNTSYPTYFARPFRSSGSGALVPLAGMTPAREVDATLLRPDPAQTTRPLFEYDPTVQNAYNNSDRNPYFRYQGLQRLGNLVTTRSNVYAVWMTIGYFEVAPVAPPYDVNIYPDGYTLGPELGSDTGDIKRHRAFYIFDRSIPVGFQRGEDLNVERAILLKRFIE